MNIEDSLLRLLVVAPLADRLDMVELSGWSRGAVYACVRSLCDGGFVESVPHASSLIARTRRFVLTVDGLVRVADTEGTTTEELLRNHPVSDEHLRLLVARLDPVAVIYRLASAIAVAARPVGIIWRRGAPQDADIALPSGSSLSAIRLGPTADRTSTSKRLYRFAQVSGGGAALVIVPDEVRMKHTRRLLADSPVTAFTALERKVAAATCENRVWRTPSTAATLNLRAILDCIGPRSTASGPDQRLRASEPAAIGYGGPEDESRSWLLPALLKPAEKNAVDLIFEWPWIRQRHVAALLGIRRSRTSELLQRLRHLGLVQHRNVGDHRRLTLTDRGLVFLARRDRVSFGALKKRWSPMPTDPEHAGDWRSVAGGRSRQLLRNIDHTEAVHRFVAMLARQARSRSLEIVQIDPPSKSARYFRHGPSVRSVHPDAYGALRRGDNTSHFFLEWERRAVRPSTMAARIAPYIRYFSSTRPQDDHGSTPTVCVVFENHLAQAQFVRIARQEMERTGVEIPLMVSRSELVNDKGPLGPVWHSVDGDRDGASFPLS
ncbi:MAG: hypothetical protein F4Y63_07920 [Chloroflexi bacterium]|nr:hypothetical protein [Chloroflexota bacterium]MYF78613.1 hypothetical protein [Chloroflexota bacterium]MYK62117.1 hypothetical protein [Chloroflexota bacterium]